MKHYPFYIFTTLLSCTLSYAHQNNDIELHENNNSVHALSLCLEKLNEQASIICTKIAELEAENPHYFCCNGQKPVSALQLTNPFVTILEEHSTTAIATTATHASAPVFSLNSGDHNTWYGNNNDLWGYDRFGRLFHIDSTNKRTLLTCCKCKRLRSKNDQTP